MAVGPNRPPFLLQKYIGIIKTKELAIMKISKPNFWAKESGQSMVEFAIAFIFLLFFLMGIFEFSWIMGNKLLATNAAREGARYASVHDISKAAEVTSTQNVVKNALVINTANLKNYTVSVQTKTDAQLGTYAEVTLSYKVDHLTGFIPSTVVDNPFPISATVKMRRET